MLLIQSMYVELFNLDQYQWQIVLIKIWSPSTDNPELGNVYEFDYVFNI